MLDLASKMTNPFYQGIFLYRAAKLYYYKNDEENCRKLLGEAMEKLKGTAWEVMIRQMLRKTWRWLPNDKQKLHQEKGIPCGFPFGLFWVFLFG